MKTFILLAVAALNVSALPSVERWKRFEIPLTGPSTGNPFVDVELSATFTLSKATDDMRFDETAASAVPTPLVALDFADGSDVSVANKGTSATSAPTAEIVKAKRSTQAPAGSSGQSLDLGSDVTSRHVVELPGDGKAFHGGLAGLEAFTITGWVQVRGGAEGAGGNRILNYCKGAGGIDLVWDAADGGRLKLAINEWPDGDHPSSAGGSMPVAPASWPFWKFFAVTYDAKAANGTENVKWYFGNSVAAATKDNAATFGIYNSGAVQDPNLPLAFGNFGSGFHANDRLLRGMLFAPKVFGTALSEKEIVAVQNRSGCAPRCGANTCGSDGCGGSCGSCSGARTCGSQGGGPRTCQMPRTLSVSGFYDGGENYKIRFAPPFEGIWMYTTHSNVKQLDGHTGSFTATKPSASNHGPVDSNGFKLQYADGTPHFSVGSTSYQWSSMPLAMQTKTLETLKNGQGDGQVFNKQRMTVFPKWYRNNHQNPVEVGTAYEILPGSIAANKTAWNCVGSHCPSTVGSFDFTRFNVAYWQNYERLVGEMQEMGVIADIIVFHPYDNDHWGFDCMGGRKPTDEHPYNTTHDNFYLKYLAARLSSYSNVWWAMANEWNFCGCKSRGAKGNNGPTPVWDELFKVLSAADIYGRQMSIHNGALLYNHSQPWITHVSLQGHEGDTPDLRSQYGKPVIWDEERYEGNISSSWGALSGEEMTDRFWWGASLGVYVGHSETILLPNVADDDQPLWWAKGGELIGQSPKRIKWLRSFWESSQERPAFGDLTPSQSYLDDTSKSATVANLMSASDGSYTLLHFLRAGRWTVPLWSADVPDASSSVKWEVRYIDYWRMTITVIATLPADAKHAVVDVPSIPGNYEIARVKQSHPEILV